MRSPNWREEELKLALELYLSKDLTWLSKMSDATEEVIALSRLLNQLDFFSDVSKPEKFRSCGSIRMKLSNFKALDERYGKSSLSNIGSSDREIWNKYHNNYAELYSDCCYIVNLHFSGEKDTVLEKYLKRYSESNTSKIREDFLIFAHDTYFLAEQFRKKSLEEVDLELSQRIVNTCFELMKVLEQYQSIPGEHEAEDEEYSIQIKEHGGVNQAPINSGKEKIGKYVQDTMCRLISEGKITQDVLADLTDPSWSKDHLHLGHPFMILLDSQKEIKAQLRDSNGHIRYWKQKHTINGNDYCICKEWYESGRKYFDGWVKSISKWNSFGMAKEQLVSVLQFIKDSDEKAVSIKREELYQRLSGVDQKEAVLKKMLEKGLLNAFQGTERELVVDDYDLLFDMLEYPEKYI